MRIQPTEHIVPELAMAIRRPDFMVKRLTTQPTGIDITVIDAAIIISRMVTVI